MKQKNIRDFNGSEFSVQEAAEWQKELNDRTKSPQEGLNSIDEIATKLKEVEADNKTKNTAQDTLITANATKNTAQDTLITANATKNTAQDTLITANATKNTAQDTLITANATKNTAQDTAIAGKDNYQKWNLKTNGVQRKGIASNDNLDITAGNNVSVGYSAGGKVIINSEQADLTDYRKTLGMLIASTGSGTHYNWYKVATFTLPNMYNNVSEDWLITGRNIESYRVKLNFEYGSNVFSRRKLQMYNDSPHATENWKAVLNNTAKTVTIYYQRVSSDWDLRRLIVNSTTNPNSRVFSNVNIGTTAPTGDVVLDITII